jgi:hypothetical protein
MRKVLPATAENVYRRFIEFEERAATIYFRFASRFSENPQLSSFWFDMAMEEKQHAGLRCSASATPYLSTIFRKTRRSGNWPPSSRRSSGCRRPRISRSKRLFPSRLKSKAPKSSHLLFRQRAYVGNDVVRSLGVDIFNTFHFAGTFKDCLFDVGVAHRLHFL